jgi:hypothetical protein
MLVSGNPDCGDLDYANGFKIDGWDSVTYPTTGYPGYLTFTLTTGTQNGFPTVVTSGPQDSSNTVQIRSEDGTYFDWIASLGIDAVIVKGGPDSNAYVYVPEDTADTDLAAPGAGFDISHVEFCYDYNLDVSKTAETTFTRTFPWTIEKSVTPDEWDLFTGDSGTSQYTVTVTKGDPVDSDWAVSGTITIENNTPFSATVTGVTDAVSPAIAVPVNCGVSFPTALAAGADLSCTYTQALADASSRTNTATVTTSGSVAGGTATADVTFGAPTTVVNDSINVDDTNGGSWQFGASGSVQYPRTFACDADEGKHDNTATIRETGQSASASVTVNCHELEVTKNATTSFDRDWTWDIVKTADQTDLTLSVGQQFLVNYSVTVSATSSDSNHAVSGSINVTNPAPIAAELTGVSDIVSPNIAADVDCGVTFPYPLAADGTLTCTYDADLPNADQRTNTATATLQNHADGVPSGTTDFSGTANVTFSSTPTTETDECIDVSDTHAGNLGTVCAGESPKTFTYSRNIGPYETCGSYTVENTASFVTNDSSATGSDGHTVNVTVPCAGCTLTPGYWKTHSLRGPAPYDDAWLNIGASGADTMFYLSGKTYYQVLWTAPNGNVYYILAHAYIAAKLNILDGASTTPAVTAAIASAETYFTTKTPTSSLTRAQRNALITLATTLDNYNNGVIGPGHCTE